MLFLLRNLYITGFFGHLAEHSVLQTAQVQAYNFTDSYTSFDVFDNSPYMNTFFDKST